MIGKIILKTHLLVLWKFIFYLNTLKNVKLHWTIISILLPYTRIHLCEYEIVKCLQNLVKIIKVFVSEITILLSLTVFLNLVAESMPTTSEAVPLIGRPKQNCNLHDGKCHCHLVLGGTTSLDKQYTYHIYLYCIK